MIFVFAPMHRRPVEIESGPERRTPAAERLRYVCVDMRLQITAVFAMALASAQSASAR